jgi:pheromone shutdown-related protein TraB
VRVVRAGGRKFALVGTAHVSQESVDLVERLIRERRPDRVCVELDPQRYDALLSRTQWENLDLREVIRRKQLATLLANLVLAAYQRRLGERLRVLPGTELLAATRVAEECGIPFELCDRPIRITLLRAWRTMSLIERSKLLALVVAAMTGQDELTEEQLRDLRRSDVLNELMAALAAELPALKRVLIDERDRYLAERIRTASGEHVLAVVGAGHVEGLCRALEREEPVDLAALSVLPAPSAVLHWIGWGVPALILASIGAIAWTKGPAVAGDQLWSWFLATSIPCGIGAVLAWAHPLTVLAAVLAAPLTTLSPLIGAGYVTAFVQAWVRPPRVRDFETATQDASSPGRWWSNRLLRVLLAFVFPTIGAMIGMYVGSYGVLSTLF